MHPLTLTWAPTISTEIGKRNLQAFIDSGYDNIYISPNGVINQKLSKIAFEEFGDHFMPFIYGQYNFPLKIALQNNVKLEDGKFVKKDIWVLDTVGTNLLNVMKLDFVDFNRTFTNDIREIYDVLGIEAARQALYNEFTEVMEFADAYINIWIGENTSRPKLRKRIITK